MDGEPPTSSKRIRVNKSAVHKEFKEISWKCPKTNQVMKGQKCLGCDKCRVEKNSKFWKQYCLTNIAQAA